MIGPRVRITVWTIVVMDETTDPCITSIRWIVVIVALWGQRPTARQTLWQQFLLGNCGACGDRWRPWGTSRSLSLSQGLVEALGRCWSRWGHFSLRTKPIICIVHYLLCKQAGSCSHITLQLLVRLIFFFHLTPISLVSFRMALSNFAWKWCRMVGKVNKTISIRNWQKN